MPGFNYGGKGDGTGWSSERGDGPAPGGGGTSNGNGGSSSSGGGSGGKAGTYGPPVSKTLGDALTTSLGIDPSNMTGYYTDADGNVIGISTLVGEDIFGVDLGPAPAGTPPKSGHDPYKTVSKNNSYWGDLSTREIHLMQGFTAVLSIFGIAALVPAVTALLGGSVAVLVSSFIDDKLANKINNVIIEPLH